MKIKTAPVRWHFRFSLGEAEVDRLHEAIFDAIHAIVESEPALQAKKWQNLQRCLYAYASWLEKEADEFEQREPLLRFAGIFAELISRICAFFPRFQPQERRHLLALLTHWLRWRILSLQDISDDVLKNEIVTTDPIDLALLLQDAIFAHLERKALEVHVENESARRLALEQQRLTELVFNAVQDAVIVTDRERRILTANPAYTAITGYSFEEIAFEDALQRLHAIQDSNHVDQMRIDLDEKGFWEGEVIGAHKTGQEIFCRLSIYKVDDESGQPVNYVIVFADITERKQNEEHIYRLAHFDLLTALPNRALLLDRLNQGLLQAKRESRLLALMFVDLDKFKNVNDTKGHFIGDLLLKAVAGRLLACIRESDTAARIGGDEFIVLLPNIQHENDARQVGLKIHERILKPYQLDGQVVEIGVSIGIAIFPDHGLTADELMSNADAAMYRAKHGGGASVVTFTELE